MDDDWLTITGVTPQHIIDCNSMFPLCVGETSGEMHDDSRPCLSISSHPLDEVFIEEIRSGNQPEMLLG